MLHSRTLKVLSVFIALLGLLSLGALVWPDYFGSTKSLITTVPYLSMYLLHEVGVPGLLEHAGLCGAGWCALSKLGSAVLVVVWFVIVWLVAWGIASVTKRLGRNSQL